MADLHRTHDRLEAVSDVPGFVLLSGIHGDHGPGSQRSSYVDGSQVGVRSVGQEEMRLLERRQDARKRRAGVNRIHRTPAPEDDAPSAAEVRRRNRDRYASGLQSARAQEST